MELVDAIGTRRSIRGFKTTLVPQDVLKEILDLARMAPSATNCQPWEFIVLTGESLEKARQVNVEQFNVGTAISLDIPVCPPNELLSPYVDRQNALARDLFASANIERSDKESRREWQLRGKRFFDAPAAILVCADEKIYNQRHQISLIDIGIATQTIALLAMEHGLGTCIQQDTVFFPDSLRKALDIQPSKRLLVAICIGYPDWEFPSNNFNRNREPLDSLVTWKS